ncbi:hypothetical protein [Mycolicibacterium llatzerense]|uniref:hypothetical protein n=1 Tax=Mycolicibacterium llatzerense TaxID=280871 RepID=UPI0031E212AA
MSLMDACARTEAAILRAQALFSPSAEPAATAAAPLTAAATSAGTAGTTMGTQSGHSAQAHTGLINQTVPHLTRAAGNDTTLQQLTTQAAQVSHTGATQLDTVLQKVKSTTAFAATAKTHAAQLSAYKALQNHVNDASNIVKNASSASDQLATDARNLTYSTDKDTPGPHIQMVDNETGGSTDPNAPKAAVDPRHPFVGDERFGQWVDVVPPPYTGDTPPPPWTGHRDFDPDLMRPGQPKGPAGPSGFYVPGGRPWADDNAPPMADVQEQYAFRMSGQDYTPYTRMVDGHQQQWVQNTYDAREWTKVNINGPAWAGKGPNDITGELGGTTTGGLGGISPPAYMHPWRPISLEQVVTMSAANPSVTYYIPDGCGGQLTFKGGSPHGGLTPAPTIPSIIAAP